MSETTNAPKSRHEQIKDMIGEYTALAAERPLTEEENAEALRRYHELLHGDDQPTDEERRHELAEACAATMHLVTEEQRERLLENGRRAAVGEDIDPVPVVRLFAPDGPQSWLLTELDEDGDTAYGLCDLGIGQPECGEVSLLWIAEQRGAEQEYREPSPYSVKTPREVYTRMRIERDPAFPRTDTPALSYLDRVASAAGRIVL